MFTPRLPFAALLGLPSLPSPPPPPVFLPGLGLMSLPEAVELLAPPLTDQEVIYYQSLLELVAGGLVTVSAAVCTVSVSPALCALSGWPITPHVMLGFCSTSDGFTCCQRQ
jgi:hypothetical protein